VDVSNWEDDPDRVSPASPETWGWSDPRSRPVGSGPPPPPPPPDRSRRARRRTRRTIGSVAAFATLVAALGVGIVVASNIGPSSSGSRPAPARPVSQQQLNAAAIATQLDPAIVDVTSTLALEGASAAGTGMVVTPSGEVLTNNHVIEGATSISVKIGSRSQTFAAKVLGRDPTDDVALLQVEGVSRLSTVKLGDSSHVTVGEPVVAIGNALNLPGPPRVTQGTISALGQSITVRDSIGHSERLTNLIQTNAALQPGNSGGPLIDAAGRVIGMNTAAAAGTPFSTANVGFAIPINAANSIVQQIQGGRESTNVQLGATAFLGVRLQPDDSANSPGGGSGGNIPAGSGALIISVNSGSPAKAAGLGAGDVITSFDGTSVSSATALTQLVHTKHPGDTVSIEWTDSSGRQHTASARLTEGPAA
jgi:S1-C subfamily serine protease